MNIYLITLVVKLEKIQNLTIKFDLKENKVVRGLAGKVDLRMKYFRVWWTAMVRRSEEAKKLSRIGVRGRHWGSDGKEKCCLNGEFL